MKTIQVLGIGIFVLVVGFVLSSSAPEDVNACQWGMTDDFADCAMYGGGSPAQRISDCMDLFQKSAQDVMECI